MKVRISKCSISLILVLALIVSVFGPYAESVSAASQRYYIRINRNTNVVTVYKSKVNGKYQDPVKAMICSVGTGNNTPTGTFSTSGKYRWWELMGPSYGQYCTRIYGGILFHSVWYYTNGNKSSISVKQYNRLGEKASHGCVRLNVADAKWIYDNCGLGTEVNIFDGSSKDDPLGKPESIKINPAKYTDWCPTDPDPLNPYTKKKPTISGTKKISIQLGTKANLTSGITARDTCGNLITSKLTYKTNLKSNKVGNYQVTYSVTDALNRTATATAVVTVYDKLGPILSGVKKKTVEYGTDKSQLLKGVTAKGRDGKNLTSSIQIKGYNPKKEGDVKVTYTVKGNGITVSKTAVIKVVDTKKPVISGAKDLTLLPGSDKAVLLKNVKAKSQSGKDLTSKIKITGDYDLDTAGEYEITYTVKNAYGTKAAKKVTLTIADERVPEITGTTNQTAALNSTPLDLLKGVAAYDVDGSDITSQIKVTQSVNYQAAGTYQVIYEVTGQNGKTVKEEVTVTITDPNGTPADKPADNNQEPAGNTAEGTTAQPAEGRTQNQ